MQEGARLRVLHGGLVQEELEHGAGSRSVSQPSCRKRLLLLGKVAHAQALAPSNGTRCGVEVPQEQPDQHGLAGAIRALHHHPHTATQG